MDLKGSHKKKKHYCWLPLKLTSHFLLYYQQNLKNKCNIIKFVGAPSHKNFCDFDFVTFPYLYIVIRETKSYMSKILTFQENRNTLLLAMAWNRISVLSYSLFDVFRTDLAYEALVECRVFWGRDHHRSKIKKFGSLSNNL